MKRKFVKLEVTTYDSRGERYHKVFDNVQWDAISLTYEFGSWVGDITNPEDWERNKDELEYKGDKK